MTDHRTDPPMVADELETLAAFLDYHRETLAWKCSGLTDEQLRERTVPPSSMSLLGLVRHLAEVERGWFRRTLEDGELPLMYSDPVGNPDGDFDDVATDTRESAFAVWEAEVAGARTAAAGVPLDSTVIRKRTGEKVSVRWIYLHMIEEYARHNGHADLLRERIDGATGE